MGSDPFYWSVTDKECHDNASEFVIPTNLTTPGGFGPVSKDQAMGVLAILSKAKLEKMSNPLDPTDRPTLVAPPAGTSAGTGTRK